MFAHVLTTQGLTVLLDSRPIAIPRSHVNFDEIVEHLNDNNPDELRRLLDVKQSVSDFTQGKIEIHDRVLTYGGQELNTSLTSKILEFMRAGDVNLAAPLINFLDKLMLNPSHRAVQGLYDWVAVSNMPIAEDGDLYAWKIVNADYFDYYSQTLDHSPGNIVTQTRNMCDEDPDQTCSNGIHFCSFGYLSNYHAGDDSRRVMLVKINPADVVAIPRDYGTAKGRCCKLTVIQQVPQDDLEDFFPTRMVYVPPKPTFQVGQVWRDSAGDKITITSVSDTEIVGRDADDSICTFDLDGDCTEQFYEIISLETLITDAIDWSQPLEDENGNPVYFERFDNTSIRQVARTSAGWCYDLKTGEHIYGQQPTIRNV